MTVLDVLQVGSENAIPAKELAARCGISRRDVAAEIHDLRERGHLICSNTGQNAGYYMAADQLEAARFVRSMQSRQREIEKAIKAAKRYCMNQKWDIK